MFPWSRLGDKSFLFIEFNASMLFYIEMFLWARLARESFLFIELTALYFLRLVPSADFYDSPLFHVFVD